VILIIVGVSVAYNFQTGRNEVKLLMEYESITQWYRMLNNFMVTDIKAGTYTEGV
jgi:hypothetical protein